jgi:hypothetical protein
MNVNRVCAALGYGIAYERIAAEEAIRDACASDYSP